MILFKKHRCKYNVPYVESGKHRVRHAYGFQIKNILDPLKQYPERVL